MLPDRPYEEIAFFGCKDYLPLLCSLTGETPNRKTVFYNAAGRAEAPGWNLQRFETKTRTTGTANAPRSSLISATTGTRNIESSDMECTLAANEKMGRSKTPRSAANSKIRRLRYSNGTHVSSESLGQIALNYGGSIT